MSKDLEDQLAGSHSIIELFSFNTGDGSLATVSEFESIVDMIALVNFIVSYNYILISSKSY